MKKKLVTEMGRIGREEFLNSDKLPLTIVLDNIRSLHNVGSVFRTSDAFRVERVLLCGITAVPPSSDIHKTALGAEDVVPWQYFADTMQAVDELRLHGYEIFAIEQVQESIPLQSFVVENNRRYAVILGNEVKGVQQQVVDACNGSIEIPQFGTKHSLNVSVTAGMVIWEFARKFGWVK
ncbi:MAG: RNA methyltransferase [Bacteroidaceae bacterium]|nr:RNA methyltransferase [Bacteroidaceae bacterium]MBQ3622337.1 RNA methyltransferase [Bacteroidaceae bacterium]